MDSEELRWSAGVPIATNPVLVRNSLAIIFLLSVAFFLVTLGAQLFFGGSFHLQQVRSAFFMALRSWGLMCALYFSVVFLLLGNRYLAVYNIGESGIRCDNLRIARSGWKNSLWTRLPFEAPEDYREIRSSSRSVSWDSITSVKAFDEYRTVVLLKGGFTVMRLFCPDRTTYDLVLNTSKNRIIERG